MFFSLTAVLFSFYFLLFSSPSPYVEPIFKPPLDDIDPEYGLHGYQLHIVLHDTVCEIMSGGFCQLFCRRSNLFILIFTTSHCSPMLTIREVSTVMCHLKTLDSLIRVGVIHMYAKLAFSCVHIVRAWEINPLNLLHFK